MKFRLFILFCVFVFCFNVSVYASAKEDLLYAIDATYYVANKPYTLPEDIKLKGFNFLRTHYLSEEDCLKILEYINEGVSLANEIGTTNIEEMSDDDIIRAMDIISKALAIADSAMTIEEKNLLDEEEFKKAKIEAEEKAKAEAAEKARIEAEKLKEIEKKKSFEKNVQDDDNANISGESDIVENSEFVPYSDDIDYSMFLSADEYEDVDINNIKEYVSFKFKKIMLIIVLGIIFTVLVVILLCRYLKRRK